MTRIFQTFWKDRKSKKAALMSTCKASNICIRDCSVKNAIDTEDGAGWKIVHMRLKDYVTEPSVNLQFGYLFLYMHQTILLCHQQQLIPS